MMSRDKIRPSGQILEHLFVYSRSESYFFLHSTVCRLSLVLAYKMSTQNSVLRPLTQSHYKMAVQSLFFLHFILYCHLKVLSSCHETDITTYFSAIPAVWLWLKDR